MRETIRSLAIICIVAGISFIVAHLVIPDKNAATGGKATASSAAPMAAVAAPAVPESEIPVVVAGGAQAESPAAAPAATIAQAERLSTPAAAQVAPPPTPSTQSGQTAQAGQPDELPPAEPTVWPPSDATPIEARSAPAKTMAALMPAKAAAPEIVTTKPNPPPVAAATPPDTAKKKRPDAPSNIRVERAAVCAGIEDRSPKGIADRFPKDSKYVCYFTHIIGARDTTTAVIHRWYHEGKLIQTAILQIRSPSWRTHSRRNMTTVEEPAGNWRVEAIDRQTGRVLETATFVME